MEIRPFKAYRYNPQVVGQAGECISPPYDVINASEQERLYGKNEHNIVRIIQGKTQPTDTADDNQYTRAAAYLKRWIASGALKEDSRPAIYGYVQDFTIGQVPFTRLSFVALAKLQDFGSIVRPHEHILKKHLEDRLTLQRATNAKFGLVYMLYKDEQRVAESVIQEAMQTGDPLIDFHDEHSVRHRLYAIDADEAIRSIVRMMADKHCIIADGHHRYTTGLRFMQESDNPEARYQMIAFANICQPGLLVLATHRLVGRLPSFNGVELLERLKRHFDIQQWRYENTADRARALKSMLDEMKRQYDAQEITIGLYFADNAFYTMTLKNHQAMDTAAPDKSPAWRSLDVSVLHTLVLDGCLGIDEDKLVQGDSVTFVKDTPTAIDDSIQQVNQGRQQIAFFTNPVRIDQIFAVTDTGERMPQKSTYFYPKMYTGLTIQKL